MSDEIMIKVKQSIQPDTFINQSTVDPILKGFFRLNDSEITAKDKVKMEEISDYLGDMEGMDKIMALKDMRYKLGHPQMGVSELNHLHKYVRVRNSIAQKENELKAMEK